MKKTKEVKAWAVVAYDRVDIGSIAPTRQSSRDSYLAARGFTSWKLVEAHDGVYSVRVSIVPVPKKRKRK